MGNETPKAINTQLTNHSHPILKQAKLINHKQQFALEIVVPVPSQIVYKKWQDKIKEYQIPSIQDQVLFLPIAMEYTKNELCGSEGAIHVKYHYPPLLLSDQIENRVTIMQPFDQAEVWYILYIIAYAASKVHEKNLIIGDIRPKNIFLFADGQIALNCLATFLDEQSNYSKSLQTKEKTFLAPQQISDLKKKNLQNLMPEISELFSIGMTIMNLMLLHDEQKLYFNEEKEGMTLFDYQKFQKQVYYTANCQIYSPILRKIVLGLLSAASMQRITAQQIINLLQPFRNKLLNLQPFQLDQNKVQGTIQNKLAKINLIGYEQQYLRKNSFSLYQNLSLCHKSSNLSQDKKQSLIINNGGDYNPFFSSHLDSQIYTESHPNYFIKNTPQTHYEGTFLASSPQDHRYVSHFKAQLDSDQKRQQNNGSSNGQHPSMSNINISFQPKRNLFPKDSLNWQSFKHEGKLQETYQLVESKISFDNKDKHDQSSSFAHFEHENGEKQDRTDVRKLSDMGRDAKSIKIPSEYKSSKNVGIEKMLRDIDEQIANSRMKYT